MLAFVCLSVPAYLARGQISVACYQLVLPQPPGGAIDLIARTLGDRVRSR